MNDVPDGPPSQVAELMAALSEQNRDWLSRQPTARQQQIADDWHGDGDGEAVFPGGGERLGRLRQDPDEYVSNVRLLSS